MRASMAVFTHEVGRIRRCDVPSDMTPGHVAGAQGTEGRAGAVRRKQREALFRTVPEVACPFRVH